MAYFDPKTFPIVSRFFKLTESEQRSVIKTERESGLDPAVRLVRILAPYQGPDVRLYELPQPAYEALEDVNALLGAKAKSIVEAVLAGDSNTIAELDAEDQRHARAIVGRHGIELP